MLDAAHIANVEQPQVYADTALKFLLNKESSQFRSFPRKRNPVLGLRFRGDERVIMPRSPSPLLAKFVRCGAGLLAEESGEMRRIGEGKLLGDVVDRLRGKNELTLGLAEHALAYQMASGDAGGAFDVVIQPIDGHAELFGIEGQ